LSLVGWIVHISNKNKIRKRSEEKEEFIANIQRGKTPARVKSGLITLDSK
jgi:hypothetical protein